jgi:hypothetical protein
MKNSIERINKAFIRISGMGDSGLDYMDGHCALDEALMEHFYDDTLATLSKAELKLLAEQLEQVLADAESVLDTE